MTEQKPPDDGDETGRARHQSRVNLIAAAGLIVLLLVMIGALKLLTDQQSLQGCLDSGRRDCVDIGAEPSASPRIIAR